eukprot:UN04535
MFVEQWSISTVHTSTINMKLWISLIRNKCRNNTIIISQY